MPAGASTCSVEEQWCPKRATCLRPHETNFQCASCFTDSECAARANSGVDVIFAVVGAGGAAAVGLAWVHRRRWWRRGNADSEAAADDSI
jgi:hypothetical protein